MLRPLDPETDVDPMHAYRSRPDACRYVPFEPSSRQQIQERLGKPENLTSTLQAEGDTISLAVVLRTSGEMIGDLVLFWRSAEHRTAEIGYILHPDHHGTGYATEACQALLALAFDHLGMHRVTVQIDTRNTASAAVARRIGMRQEGQFLEGARSKGEWISLDLFALLETEWRLNRASTSQS
jgi:RimJ/RimL family protein N-acetyltransferase